MGRKGILLTIAALIFAVGAGIAGIAFVRSKYVGTNSGPLGPDPRQSEACDLEAKRPQKAVWSLHAGPLDNGKWKATFKLRSNNAFDAYWYLEFSDPPLKDYAGQHVFRVRDELFEMDTVEADLPTDPTRSIDMRMGRQNRSYAYLTEKQLDAMDKGQTVAGRYPLATSSVVTQVNGDNGNGRTHFTRNGDGQAVDLHATPGTEVLSFGAGTVVFVEDGYDDQLQCGDKHVRTYGNVMAILQDDGYEAIYGHLKMRSSIVTEGVRVRPGQPLAKIGAYNGFESNAHLHFQLGGMTEKGLVSVPVAFEDPESNSVIIPQKGKRIDWPGKALRESIRN